jgi:lipid II:glycine glycyltransferase (peptidoglycan interpeptide bridge formation enzyme)
MPEISLSEWYTFLAKHPAAHLLQSGEWGQLKSAFGWEAVHIIKGETGAQILFRRLPLGFTWAYMPKGPVTASTSEPSFWSTLDLACRSRHAVFLKVEPDGWEEEGQPSYYNWQGFVTSPQHIQPHSTLVIDLHGSLDDIFNRMKPKTRYNIRLAGRKEVVVHPSDDIETFYKIMTITGQREEFHVHSQDYYRRAYDLFHPKGMCELFMADFQGHTLATLMVFAHGRQAYYFYGASSDGERNRKATYPLQWEAIRWANTQGCEEYDMWGIPDEATDVDEDEAEAREDGLWGVYRFKRGFGGVVKRAIPTLDRIYNPLLYKLYLWRFSGTSAG